MEIHPHGMPLFKAAGVSFDGRQERLQKLYNQNPWRKLLTQKTHYNGEPARAIWDAASGWQLGWVPKDLVQTYYKNNGEFDGEIVVGGDFCGLRVYSHEQPSQKLYRLVKQICQEKQVPLPPYCRLAYKKALRGLLPPRP